MNPLVSIVLPTHNGARHLRQAIESCLLQTCPDWELIIVDDGSSDSTPEIVADGRALDARIRSVRHERNRRLPAALNTGFALARGQYLTWTSDDNWYRPEALKRMVSVLEENRDAGVVYCDFSMVDVAGVLLRQIAVRDPSQLIFQCTVGPCFLYRRSVARTVGPYAGRCFLAEDYDFWLRASRQYRFVVLHEDLYCYRAHPGSLTGRRLADAHRASDRVRAKNVPRLNWVHPHEKAAVMFSLARRAAHRRQWCTVAWRVLRATQFSPALTLSFLWRKL